jgi:hypothetical protein
MKDFTILVGPSEDTLTKVLGSQLKNDPTPETFELKHVNGAGIMTPSRYVKIIPHKCVAAFAFELLQLLMYHQLARKQLPHLDMVCRIKRDQGRSLRGASATEI